MGEQFTLGRVHEVVSEVVPERECVIGGDRRLTYREVTERSRRLASYLHGRGLGVHTERGALANHEAGQDLIGLYLYNGNEYLEGMLGAFKARVAPFNVNYRYVEEELTYLLKDAGARALVYGASFAPQLAKVLPALPGVDVLVQVDDGSGHDLLPGAVDYEAALASSPAELPPVQPSPDDLYVLYTGGTTGMPKGVLWRSDDIFQSAMGGRMIGVWTELQSEEELRERVAGSGELRMLIIPPLMHGAAQWASFIGMSNGYTIVFPDDVRRMDPADAWRVVEREGITSMTVVGDAIARPLIDELEKGGHDPSSLLSFGNGGAPLNPSLKARLLAVLPNVLVVDSVGSSESGAQGTHVSVKGAVATGTFQPGPGMTVANEELDRILEPGHDGNGWLAQGGRVPLGYLGDAAKTARTFPVIEGVRYAVPGDRARLQADGAIELLGRDAVTINTGGEKVFAEEVEQALADHPSVQDVVAVGRPSERWGSEIVAVVQVAEGKQVTGEELSAHASTHVARYKLPKAYLFVPAIQRSPAGKADYRWARELATAG